MGRAPLLTHVQQAQVDVALQLGCSLHAIARLVKKSRSAIRRYINNPLEYGKKVQEGKGRPRKLTVREERNVARIASNSPKSLNEIKGELKLGVCKKTVHNIIKRSGVIVSQKMKKAVKMTADHKARRLEFVKQNMTRKWENVLFSDEKK